jgi:hypothetical protein
MPIALIDFDKIANDFAVSIAEAKRRGSYNGGGIASAAKFDAAVMKALSDRVHAALKVTGDYYEKVKKHHAASKKAIDDMTALIKKKGKTLAESDIKVLETSARLCATLATQINDTSMDIMPGLIQYRGGWPATYRDLLSPAKQGDLNALQKLRNQDIDTGKTVDALKKRLEEYAVRAPELVKVAKQAAGKESVLAGTEKKARETFTADVTKLKDDYDTFAHKARNSLSQLAALNPKQKLDAGGLKNNDSRLANGKAEAKNARGVHKTLALKVDTYKKLAAKIEGQEKQAAATALAAAAKELATVAKDVPTLTALEVKAEKTVEAIKKLK